MELLRVSPKNPQHFKVAIDTISSFLSEGVFEFGEKGLSFQAIDPSSIVYVSMEAPREAFFIYELHHPEVRVPLSIRDLQKRLGRLSAGDSLLLAFSTTVLTIVMEGQGVKREFFLPAIDVKETSSPVSLPGTLSTVKLPVSYFREALKDASIISKHVMLTLSDEGFVVEAREGSNVSKTVIHPEPGISISVDATSSSQYLIDYLLNIIKGAESEILLEFSNNSPIRISYPIGDINMTFILAPLIL
jgi:DNA polymerase III sliding clamp (beta) subunit (PCNA family)